MMNNEDFLIFYEDCQVVLGYNRGIIYDLTRPSNSHFIPKDIYEFISKSKKNSLKDTLELFNGKDRGICEQYVEFLIKNEFAFIGDKHLKEHLIPMPFKTKQSQKNINNAIVCVCIANYKRVLDFIAMLDVFLCEHVEVRLKELHLEGIQRLFETFENTCIETITVRSSYRNEKFNNKLNKLILDHTRIRSNIVYDSPTKNTKGINRYLESKMDLIKDCGKINKNNFKVNLSFYSESQNCNTCLFSRSLLTVQPFDC